MPPKTTLYPAGQSPQTIACGDFILTGKQDRDPLAWAIRTAARLRRYPKWARVYDHAALILDGDGLLASAEATGVVYQRLSDYHEADYTLVRTGVEPHDQAQITLFAQDVINAKHNGYGYVTFAGLALYALTGLPVFVQQAQTSICSGLVADALTRAGVIWPKPPFALLPADLALWASSETGL